MTGKMTAERYRVHWTTIYAIRRGKRWAEKCVRDSEALTSKDKLVAFIMGTYATPKSPVMQLEA